MAIVKHQEEDDLQDPRSPHADIASMALAELLGLWRSRVAEEWKEEP
jgi:hypothetical protein